MQQRGRLWQNLFNYIFTMTLPEDENYVHSILGQSTEDGKAIPVKVTPNGEMLIKLTNVEEVFNVK